MRLIPLFVALALLTTVGLPLHPDAPAWAWSWWLFAALAALVASPSSTPGHSPASAVRHTLGPAMACLLAACLLNALMGAWHGEGWRTMRQDGKVLLALPTIGLLIAGGRLTDAMAKGAGFSSDDSAARLREAVGWALGLQLVVAMVVALQWPRAWLPATSIPWATAVAMSIAVLAPLALSPDGQASESRAWRAGLALAIVAGLAAVVWSRSRAAWIIMPWLGVLMVALSTRRGRSAVIVSVLSLAAVAAGLWYDSQQPAQVERGVRLLDLLQELQGLDEPDVRTSLGSRWLLWQAGWETLWSHPWTGIGLAERIALVQRVVPPDQLTGVAPLVHVHQQFLNQGVDHGLPGLAAAMLSAAAPFALAWRSGSNLMRWQCFGVGMVHGIGLLFNANMTHGPYAFHLGLTLAAILLMNGRALTPSSRT